MIKQVDITDPGLKRCGPKIDKTKIAQAAVDEFLESGADAAEVDWESIDPDWTQAKRAIAYRIRYSTEMKLDGADDLGMRSNREDRKLYLVHKSRMKR